MQKAEVEKYWEGESDEDPVEQPQEEDDLSEEALLEEGDEPLEEVDQTPDRTAR